MNTTDISQRWARLGIPRDYARTRGLPLHRDVRRLVLIGPAADDGQPVRLAPPAARAWKRMCAAAAADGVRLLALSGYRSVARQTLLFRRKLSAGQTVPEILRLMAAPGCSEHHTGRAIDIGSPAGTDLEEVFARTPEYRWLRRHAEGFGYQLSYPRKNPHGILFEPWHWCWHKPAK
ncbi:MAG: D-alanyl-D-alanine carboxypeptidase family protein [Opitutales bacterium]